MIQSTFMRPNAFSLLGMQANFCSEIEVRSKCIQELFTSEQDYLKTLRDVIEVITCIISFYDQMSCRRDVKQGPRVRECWNDVEGTNRWNACFLKKVSYFWRNHHDDYNHHHIIIEILMMIIIMITMVIIIIMMITTMMMMIINNNSSNFS